MEKTPECRETAGPGFGICHFPNCDCPVIEAEGREPEAIVTDGPTARFSPSDVLWMRQFGREEGEREAYQYLRRIFETCAPECTPLPDLLGLCTQIDNLIAGYRIQLGLLTTP